MDPSLNEIVLLGISVSVAFNLFLTLRLIAIVNTRSVQVPFAVTIGEPIPGFEGKVFSDGRRMMSGELIGQAAVLVFLAAGCTKCLTKLPELQQINHSMQRLGMPLWIVGVDSARGIARHLKSSELLPNLLVLDPATRRSLNPHNASPFYVFIDHEGAAQARSLIGDENWQIFVEQLNEDQPQEGTG
jgi:hypothetical protein